MFVFGNRHPAIEVPGDADMSMKAGQPIDAVQCHVYLVPDKFKGNLPRDVVEALKEGRAAYESELMTDN